MPLYPYEYKRKKIWREAWSPRCRLFVVLFILCWRCAKRVETGFICIVPKKNVRFPVPRRILTHRTFVPWTSTLRGPNQLGKYALFLPEESKTTIEVHDQESSLPVLKLPQETLWVFSMDYYTVVPEDHWSFTKNFTCEARRRGRVLCTHVVDGYPRVRDGATEWSGFWKVWRRDQQK